MVPHVHNNSRSGIFRIRTELVPRHPNKRLPFENLIEGFSASIYIVAHASELKLSHDTGFIQRIELEILHILFIAILGSLVDLVDLRIHSTQLQHLVYVLAVSLLHPIQRLRSVRYSTHRIQQTADIGKDAGHFAIHLSALGFLKLIPFIQEVTSELHRAVDLGLRST